MQKKKTLPAFDTTFAKIISYIFHPLMMPAYGFCLLFFTENYIATFTSLNQKYLVLVTTLVFTFLLPVINIFILLKLKRINSLEMETNSERSIPYLSTTLYFFALYYLFYNAGFSDLVCMLVLAAAVSILLTFIINIWWKISAHMIGIGGVTGNLMGLSYLLAITDFQIVIVLGFLCSGLIGYARLRLNAHNPPQVYLGFAVGFFTSLLVTLIY